jgi:CHAT domain-containing protein
MKIGILLGMISCFSIAVHGQDSIKDLLDSAESIWFVDFDKTNELVKKAEHIAAKKGITGNVSDLINLYDIRIQSCHAFNRFQLWRQYIQELQEFLEENKSVLDPKVYEWFQLIKNLSRAQYFNAISDNISASQLFVKLISDLKKLPQSSEVCNKMNVIANDLADIHRRNGEYEAAINQLLASITYLECSGLRPEYALVYRNIGFTYLEQRDFKQASKYLKLAEDSLQRMLKKTPAARVALSLYESESSYYERMNRYDSAMVSMQKATPLLKLKKVDDSFKGRINLSIGTLYMREGKLATAQPYLDQAEGFFLNSQEDQPLYLSKVYMVRAELFEKLGKTNDALKYCAKALERLVLNYKPDADGNPHLEDLFSKKQVFKVLQKKSQLLEKLFLAEKETKILISAANANKLALTLLDSTANEISLDKDKVILAEETYSAFEDGIRLANTLYKQTGGKRYLDDCFTLVDKSKGILLLENLRSVNRFSGINPEWLSREKEIKSELLLTEQDLYKLEIENKSTTELAASRERYGALKRDYASLISKIKTEAPDYYRLRFDHSVISANEVQSQSLKKGEALIEYFVGDSTLAIVSLSANKQHVEVKKIQSDFFEKINQFKTVLTTSSEMKEDPLFTKLSSDLYAFLVRDAIRELGPGITSLTIIPDGILGYIPFEVFRATNSPENIYLGDEYTIHYGYSATYLKEQMQRRNAEAKYFFAGFVSSDAEQINDQKLAALPGAKKEITSITELLGSNYSLFIPASKKEFLNNASDFSILHLAMHSLVNDENPMFSVLVFSPSVSDSADNRLLTALELYNMNLNSELAVLSACNTGFGTLHRGEGIMSFARAFAYAGVPSAVISLWQVPDKATSKIMVNFYKYLKSGEGKDLALRHAKMQFVKDYPQMAAPFYWAGFILTGNKDPLQFPSLRTLYWTIAGLLIAEIFLLIASRKMAYAKSRA